MKEEIIQNKNNILKNNEIIKTSEEKIKNYQKEIDVLKSRNKEDNGINIKK